MCVRPIRYWEDNLPTDLIPPADFDAPTSATNNGKDSSATAVVASALLELFIVTGKSTYKLYTSRVVVSCFVHLPHSSRRRF